MTSGIATMSKEIVLGTVKHFDWVQLASGINHPEAGKIVDLNEDVRRRTGCLLYTSPSPRDGLLSRMPSSA